MDEIEDNEIEIRQNMLDAYEVILEVLRKHNLRIEDNELKLYTNFDDKYAMNIEITVMAI